LVLTFQNGTTVHDVVDKLYVSDVLAADSKRMAEANTSTESAHATNLLGLEYLSVGDYKSANRYFNKALQHDPSFAAAHYNLGLIHWRQKDWNSYVSEYKILANMDKKRAARLKALGMPKDVERRLVVEQPISPLTPENQSVISEGSQ
jgi:Tfp pilus assembly protein PilF